jgi:hypothetical protein
MKRTQNTTIQISLEIKRALDSLKKYRRETYNDILVRLIEEARKTEPKETNKSRKTEAATYKEKAEKLSKDPSAELEY